MVTVFKDRNIDDLFERVENDLPSEEKGGRESLSSCKRFHGQETSEQSSYERLWRMFPVRGTRFKNEVFEDLIENDYFYRKKSSIPVGYTYLGQFITHDISHLSIGEDRTSGVSISINSVDQLASPSLDLDSLYGDIQGFGYHIDKIKKKEGYFYSQFSYQNNNRTVIYDIPRDEKRAHISYLVGDARNDDNFLTAQLHVLFLNMHNRFMDIHINAFGADPETAFQKSRNEITLLYQQVIRYDFLQKVLQKKVYHNLFVDPDFEELLEVNFSEEPRIPVEFTAAAMRFGHSMVRHEYLLNDNNKTANLNKLFQLTGRGGRWQDILSENFIVDWKFFFDMRGYSPDPDQGGDGRVTRKPERTKAVDLELDISLKKMILEDESHNNLARRNLRRGKELDIPCGQEIVDYLLSKEKEYSSAMGLEHIDPANVDLGSASQYRKIVEKWKLSEKIPLWSYLLIEPFFLPGLGDDEHRHSKLGVLGSIIVGEVFKSLLMSSRTSIYHNEFDMQKSAFGYFFKQTLGKDIRFEEVGMPELVCFTYYNKMEWE